MAETTRAGLAGRAIRTLLVDDEPLARQRVRTLLESDPAIDVVGECGDGEAALELIRSARPDLLFLDVEMPKKNGFETLRALGDEPLPFIVFVTAYDAYAVRAFEVHALDYLLKPFDDERFAAALERAKTEAAHHRDAAFAARVAEMLDARERRNGAGPGMTDGNGGSSSGTASSTGASRESTAEPAGPTESANGHLSRLVVKRSGRVRFVEVDSVDWFEAADYYVRIHAGEESFLIRTTMKRLERELDPARFIRIHRSTIVRIDFIRELQPYFRGEYVVVLEDGTRRSLSRSRRKKLERALGQTL